MAIIYKATHKENGKSYVGYTGKSLEKRIYQHKWEANNKTRTHFQKALKKYGIDSFEWTILYEHTDKNHCLDTMEDHYITQYDAISNGYNMMRGGFKGPSLIGPANGMYGKTHTPEVRAKLSQSARERYTGLSYEERHGVEKAIELKKQRSVKRKAYLANKNITGVNNANADQNVYVFIHTSGKSFTGTRCAFRTNYPEIHKVQLCKLVKKQCKQYKGWIVT